MTGTEPFIFGLTAAETALVAGGTLLAASQIQQGRIAKAQGRLSKKIAVANQQELKRQATAELEAGEIEASRVSRREKIAKAAAIVQLAGKGGGGIRGASLNFLIDFARQFSIDKNLTLRNRLLRSRSLLFRGRVGLAEGRFAESVGKAQRSASILSAFGTGLATFGTVGGGSGGTSGSPSSTNIGTSQSVSLGISPRP